MFSLLLFAAATAAILLIAFGPVLVALATRFWAQIVAVAGLPRLLRVVALFLLVPSLAAAQEAVLTAAPVEAVSWTAWLISVCATIVTGAVVLLVQRFTGITVQKAAQDSLHRAIETGAKAVTVKLGVDAALDARIDGVVAYVNRSVPDAVRKLAPEPDVLRDLATAKLGDLVGQFVTKARV